MAYPRSQTEAGLAGQIRIAAIVALVLALGLLGARGMQLVSQPGAAVAGSALETRLTHMLEPVVGEGHVRVSVTRDGSRSKTIFAVVNTLPEAAPEKLETIQRILEMGAGVNLAAGDRIVIEELAFASALPGELSGADYFELAGLVGLIGLLGWVALSAREAVPQAAAVNVTATAAPADERAIAPEPEPIRRVTSTTRPADVSGLVKADPARAAEVVRGWMNGKAGAA